jgi:hypothetical protein
MQLPAELCFLNFLDLQPGDRLEPSYSNPDIASIDTATSDLDLVFWRRTAQSGPSHRNPLFDTIGGLQLGISPECISVDWLHCLSLGVFKEYCSAVVQKLLHVDQVFGKIRNAEVRAILGSEQIQNLLMEWYAAEGKAGRKHSKLQRIEPTCFGTFDTPAFNFHGAETNGLLNFFLFSSCSIQRLQITHYGCKPGNA